MFPFFSRHDAACGRRGRRDAARHAAVRWLQPHWQQRVRFASASRVLRTVVNVMRLSGMGTGSVMQRGEVSSLTSGATPNVITGFTL